MTTPIHLLSRGNSTLSLWMNQLRSLTTQQDRLRFRRNIERIGEVAAYEISKTLPYNPTTIQTPLGKKASVSLEQQPVILSLMRAGLPLFQGVLNYFDQADSGFIGTYRKHSNSGFSIQQSYVTCPQFGHRPLIICDPMLATGASLCEALQEILSIDQPSSIHIVAVIAAQKGIDRVIANFPEVRIWVADIDADLNSNGYIVPGLGDAGDLSYGQKLQD